MTVLVFPSCLEDAARFADEAHRWRQRVIGASSLDIDPYADRYDAWEKLPFIGESRFFAALSALVERQNIDFIFLPHAATFNFLEAELPAQVPQLCIIGEGPFKSHVRQMEDALKRAERDLLAIGAFGVSPVLLSVEFVASLLLQMDRIFGQCSREKAQALCAVVPSAVHGDVVEIGSMFGKSAYVLNRLAAYFHIGGTLAVDPWRRDLAIQYDAPANIQNTPHKWNWEILHRGFLINMLGCAVPPFNYLRSTSAEGFSQYCASPVVTSREFGTTSFAGSISVLHIDGNHDEAAVAEDFDLWSSRLAPGAWIIFDDYNWVHGGAAKCWRSGHSRFWLARTEAFCSRWRTVPEYR